MNDMQRRFKFDPGTLSCFFRGYEDKVDILWWFLGIVQDEPIQVVVGSVCRSSSSTGRSHSSPFNEIVLGEGRFPIQDDGIDSNRSVKGQQDLMKAFDGRAVHVTGGLPAILDPVGAAAQHDFGRT